MTLLMYAPLDSWLVLLLAGWRFSGDVAEPMPHSHGEYSCLMWRAA